VRDEEAKIAAEIDAADAKVGKYPAQMKAL
jgi:hypothetical protein